MTMSANATSHLEIGAELPPRVQQVTQDGITAFHVAFGGSNPIHTDPGVARQSRFGATLQHGVRTLYPIYAMLFERYPHGLTAGGGVQAKFIAPVVPGDVITSHCRAVERRSDGGRQTLVFETWAENQAGTRVLVGTASVAETAR